VSSNVKLADGTSYLLIAVVLWLNVPPDATEFTTSLPICKHKTYAHAYYMYGKVMTHYLQGKWILIMSYKVGDQTPRHAL